MNRIELEQEIIREGKVRGIIVTKCGIYDRGNCLDFYLEIRNNESFNWIFKHQVEELIADLSPLERPSNIKKIGLDMSRSTLFEIGDSIEVDDIWIRLDAGEEEPRNLIKISTCCGQYRHGWVKGEVFETPEQNDRALGIKFKRDIYIESPNIGWIDNVTTLEKFIKEDKISKVEAGQPIWSGTHTWTIRKP